jgi:hypothetical protein
MKGEGKMGRLYMRGGTLALALVIVIISCIFLPTQAAAAATQGEFVVVLAERLGLGAGLSEEEAVAACTSVGIVPKDGWQLDLDATCEFIEEIQILVIKAAQEELIRYEPDDIPLLMASLSDELDCCPPPAVVIYPSVDVNPPAIEAPLIGETGVGEKLSPSN